MKKNTFLNKLSVIFRVLFCKSFLFVTIKNKGELKEYDYRTNIERRDDIIYLERVLTDLKENINSTNNN